MQIYNQTTNATYALAEQRAHFMRRVYNWMTGGILLTAIIASLLAGNPEAMMTLVKTPFLFTGIIIAQLVLVIGLSAAINRISAATATLLFLAYAALTGVTFSTLFMTYTHDTIAGVFFATAAGFAGLSLVGYTTKKDLGPVGAFCGMALFGLIGWGLMAFFFPSLMGGSAQFIYSVIGVVIFAGLTAYDTQKIKNMHIEATGAGAAEMESKAAIFGALTLYLDFINLFLMLLRLFGGDRRR